MTIYKDTDKEVMYNTHKSRNKSLLQELINFAKESGYTKIGIANCKALQPYADKLKQILENAQFEVYAINCKDSCLNGNCICEEMNGPCCDPISQAKYLNESNTQLNINVGLCLGHGIIFAKHSHAPVTTFIIKDFASDHNPIENLR